MYLHTNVLQNTNFTNSIVLRPGFHLTPYLKVSDMSHSLFTNSIVLRTGFYLLSPSTDLSDHIIQPHSHHMSFNPEDGSSMFFLIVSIHLQDYTMSQLRRPQSKQCCRKFSKLTIKTKLPFHVSFGRSGFEH
jgi:hypothetical protein